MDVVDILGALVIAEIHPCAPGAPFDEFAIGAEGPHAWRRLSKRLGEELRHIELIATDQIRCGCGIVVVAAVVVVVDNRGTGARGFDGRVV